MELYRTSGHGSLSLSDSSVKLRALLPGCNTLHRHFDYRLEFSFSGKRGSIALLKNPLVQAHLIFPEDFVHNFRWLQLAGPEGVRVLLQ